MNDSMPLADFIRKHVKGLGFDYRECEADYYCALGSAFRAAKDAGYELDKDFVPMFCETLYAEILE